MFQILNAEFFNFLKPVFYTSGESYVKSVFKHSFIFTKHRSRVRFGCGAGILRAAIASANPAASDDTINFAIPAGIISVHKPQLEQM